MIPLDELINEKSEVDVYNNKSIENLQKAPKRKRSDSRNIHWKSANLIPYSQR